MGDEEPGTLELVVRDEPIQIGAVRDAIEDVRSALGAVLRVDDRGPDDALAGEVLELLEA